MADDKKAEHDERAKSMMHGVAHVGISPEKTRDGYGQWATQYEQDLLNAVYLGPYLAAKYLADQVPENDRPTTRVLDIGAGTGLAAIELRKLGFKTIDGLDPCAEMLDEAKKRDLYDKYIVEYVTQEPLNIPENSYDHLTGSGIFAEGGHVKPEACDEMIRLVKPGGYIVLSTRTALVMECVTYKDKLEPYMDKLESQGRWKRILRDTGRKFYADREAVVYVYQVV